MWEASCFIFFVLAVFGFAVYGFVFAVRRFSKWIGTSETSVQADERTAQQVNSTCLILNRLRRSGSLSAEQYGHVRDLLEAQFPRVGNLPPCIDAGASPVAHGRKAPSQSDSAPARPTVESIPPVSAPPAGTVDRPGLAGDRGVDSPQTPFFAAEIVEAEIVGPEVVEPQGVAPWDRPDPPPRPPRRPLSEMLAGFMQDNNIRWGELASGILIVGSSVGLVLSLREQLQETIPYFSALVFMLITVAINAAGIYTLRRWKLRNTSRGVLVIGLLLVPLNFLAGCILTGDRRGAADPMYWIAVVVGVAVFGTLTWHSGKHLLRRGQLPLVLAILGCSLALLINNRLALPSGRGVRLMLLTLPMVIAFMAGFVRGVPRQWTRTRWAGRTLNRLLLLLGLSAFSFFVAAALLFIRLPDRIEAGVVLMPAFAAISVMVAWIGCVVQQGARGDQVSHLGMTGATLSIMGQLLAFVTVVLSIVNPTVMLATSLVAGGLLCCLAMNRRLAVIMPGVWACLGVASLSGLNLALGIFELDRWASVSQMRQAIVSGAAGLCLMVVGFAVVASEMLMRRWGVVDASDRQRTHLSYVTAAGAAVLGCVLALAASFVDPQNLFDVTTATVLLLVLAATAFFASFRWQHQTLPYAAAGWLVAALLHALFWNQAIGRLIVQLSWDVDVRWACLTIVTGVCCSLASVWLSPFRSTRVADGAQSDSQTDAAADRSRAFHDCGFVAICGSVVTGLVLVPHHVGLGTLALVVASFTALALNYARREPISSLLFSAVTAFLTATALAELTLWSGWCESLAEPQHLWIQLIGMSCWCALWITAATAISRQDALDWLLRDGTLLADIVMYAVAALITLLIACGLALNVHAELSSRAPDLPDNIVQLANNLTYVLGALAGVAAALLISLFVRPVAIQAATLIVVWLLFWSLGCLPFESVRGTGSALRWLLPLAGAMLAPLIAARGVLAATCRFWRSRFRLSGQPGWTNTEWQYLINLSLILAVSVVLLISTAAVAQLLLYGAAALGGPVRPSLLGDLRKDVSYGVPIAIMVATFLFYAVSERRSWLAVAGSCVFQYIVLLSIVLLALSPHPKLASEWFLNILQAVSLGMTVYGFVWLACLQRIGGGSLWSSEKTGTGRLPQFGAVSQLDVHVVLNTVLVGSLSVLVLQRIFLFPAASVGWINEAGGWLGYLSLLLVAALVITRWPAALRAGLIWFVGLVGLGTVCLIATTVDRNVAPASWWPLRTILIGCVSLVVAQTLVVAWQPLRGRSVGAAFDDLRASQLGTSLPILSIGALATLFAIRGALSDPSGFWLYLSLMLVLVSIATLYGFVFASAWASVVSAAATLVAATMFVVIDPFQWFQTREPSWIHAWIVGLVWLSLVWLAFYLYQRHFRKQLLPRRFVGLPNAVLLIACGWVVLGSGLEWLLSTGRGSGGTNIRALATPLGAAVIISSFGLLLLNVWNDRGRARIATRYLWSFGVVVLTAVLLVKQNSQRPLLVALPLGVFTAGWAQWWRNRKLVNLIGRAAHIPRRAATRRLLQQQIPRFHLVVATIVLLIVTPGILWVEPRWLRYICSLAVFPIAFAFGAFADQRRVWIRWASLTLLTLACLILSWADLSPTRISQDLLSLPVRSLLVLAAAMFVYGAILPRVIDTGNSWIPTIRQATVATCALTIFCFAAVISLQIGAFRPELGSGLAPATALAVGVMILGMAAGLICIAVMPQHDPLALNLQWRMGYVYAAETVLAALVLHLYLAMPWLFQLGIKQFWPYVAMLMSFGGVALANLLKRRDLEVFAQPLFHTAAIIPVTAASLFWAIDSRADPSLVMLLAGGIYLLISRTRSSLLSGAATVLFGNLALWLFYNKFPALALLEHPQLWLIPPAISLLAAGHLHRDRLDASRLTSLRYLCVAVIYVSSTSEVFISGIGQQLWPPMVLALLSVAGMMVGILLQVRAYLYLGSLFLLTAVITMVSHAHQRLGHVWPWWAFSLVLGIAILIFFGLFEKRRNDMREMARKLSQWDR